MSRISKGFRPFGRQKPRGMVPRLKAAMRKKSSLSIGAAASVLALGIAAGGVFSARKFNIGTHVANLFRDDNQKLKAWDKQLKPLGEKASELKKSLGDEKEAPKKIKLTKESLSNDNKILGILKNKQSVLKNAKERHGDEFKSQKELEALDKDVMQQELTVLRCRKSLIDLQLDNVGDNKDKQEKLKKEQTELTKEIATKKRQVSGKPVETNKATASNNAAQSVDIKVGDIHVNVQDKENFYIPENATIVTWEKAGKITDQTGIQKDIIDTVGAQAYKDGFAKERGNLHKESVQFKAGDKQFLAVKRPDKVIDWSGILPGSEPHIGEKFKSSWKSVIETIASKFEGNAKGDIMLSPLSSGDIHKITKQNDTVKARCRTDAIKALAAIIKKEATTGCLKGRKGLKFYIVGGNDYEVKTYNEALKSQDKGKKDQKSTES